MNTLKAILSYLHQLPQHLLALLLRQVFKGNDSEYNGCVVRRSFFLRGGISLGQYIIVNQWMREDDIKHEYGHSIQSRYLGWLYLIVIGLPSLLWAVLYGRVTRQSYNGYYKFYTEKWADKLGGVQR